MERNITHIALFAALIAVLGLIPKIDLMAGVPITAQSLGIMLCGTVLGAKRGALAVILFLVLVAAGLPLLSGGRGGIGLFTGPSAGFLFGFPVAAFVAGWIVEHWRVQIGVSALAGAFLGGIVVMYLFGIPVLAAMLSPETAGKMFANLPFHASLPLPAALAMLYLPGDLIKVALAAMVTQAIARMRPSAVLSRT